MLNVSINLTDRFPITDGVRLEYLLKELNRHAYSTNGEASPSYKPPVFSPELELDKKYITPDKIQISLHHSSADRDSYVCFHGNNTVDVRLLSEAFFYSLHNNFASKEHVAR